MTINDGSFVNPVRIGSLVSPELIASLLIQLSTLDFTEFIEASSLEISMDSAFAVIPR